jgi:hypothetical protein
VAVDYQLLARWCRSQNALNFERAVEDAVSYVERRASAVRAAESVARRRLAVVRADGGLASPQDSSSAPQTGPGLHPA